MISFAFVNCKRMSSSQARLISLVNLCEIQRLDEGCPYMPCAVLGILEMSSLNLPSSPVIVV